ncbi:DUF4157 domain-containing protein [Sporocytophaga myxococcoides]|uniref:eCIS core domain-containing protein n=1 Tax=Sporocytophaga myxococcoides TaxID=153721 RepID=UPI0003F97474|nr:DUF4157 domain-containing protein [Sporocytophaga myxococcoides]
MGEFLHKSRQGANNNRNLHQSQQTQLKTADQKSSQNTESKEEHSQDSSSPEVLQRKWDSAEGGEGNNEKKGPVPSMMVEEEEEPVQRKGPVPLQLQAAEEEELPIQRKGPVPAMNVESEELSQSNTSSSGKMPQVVQKKMESSFGQDFSDVNIHTNSSQSKALNAHAFTQGNDIHFAPGKYSPESQSGQELLGHELTHVVQQREGRVQPTVQKKGANINDDKGLEKEADEMGERSAKGMSSTVNGKSNGIQLKEEPTLDINVQDNTFSSDVVVPGMTNLGSFSYIHAISQKRVNEYVLTASKEKWATVLKYADSGPNFMTFIIGFLKASNDPSWIKNGDPNVMKQNGKVINITRAPSDQEKLEFLKALYGVEINSEVDLVDSWHEKGLDSYEGVTTPELAEFIGKHQHLLVNYASGKKGDQQLGSAGIKNLATQGTPDVTNPVLVKSMMQSAFSNAISATKIILADSLNEKANGTSSIDAYDMVVNSAIILNNTLDSYGSSIKDMQAGLGVVFDNVWGAIPIPGNAVVKFIAGKAQDYLKAELTSSMNLPVTDNMKEEYINKYSSFVKTACIKILEENSDKIDSRNLTLSYGNLISGFKAYMSN